MSGDEEFVVIPCRTKDDLLRELSRYVDPDTGRKHRSDAGQPRHIYNTTQMYQTKMHVYKKVRGRLVRRDQELRAQSDSNNSILSLEFDENGFYIPIPESYKTQHGIFKQVYKGREIYHTTRKVRTQKYVDLEHYRFDAWQEMAQLHPDNIVEPNDDLRGLLFHRYNFTTEQSNQAIINRQINWLTLFCETYFIRPNEINVWDYDTWKEYYNSCPVGPLDDDFEFIYGCKPGTSDFHPEWEYLATRKAQEKKESEEQEAQRKSDQYIANMRRRTH